MPPLRAELRLLSTDEGGRSAPLRSEHRARVRFAGSPDDFGCTVELVGPRTPLEPGATARCRLAIWAFDLLPPVTPGQRFALFDDASVIGHGTLLDPTHETLLVAWLRRQLIPGAGEDLVSSTLGPGIYAYEDDRIALRAYEHGFSYRASDESFECLYAEIEGWEMPTFFERSPDGRTFKQQETGRLEVQLRGRQHVMYLPMRVYCTFAMPVHRVVNELVRR